MLARAPRDSFSFCDFGFQRTEIRSFVRTVAERLALRTPAGAPPIRARFDFLDDRTFLEDNRVAHDAMVDRTVMRSNRGDYLRRVRAFFEDARGVGDVEHREVD